MEPKQLSIAMIGMGAIGGVSAAFIKLAGYQIHAVCKYPDYAQQIQTTGIHVIGERGEHHVTMPAVATIQELKGTFDLIFLAVKALDLMVMIDQIKTIIKPNTLLVAMENGIIEDQMIEIFGKDHVVGCIVGWGGTMHENKTVEMTSLGEFVIGTPENRTDERIMQVQTILASVLPCRISTNFYGDRYSKLIINACITALGAVCGLYLGEMLSVKRTRIIFLEIMKEAIAVSNAMGWKVEAYNGKIDYYKIVNQKNAIGLWKNHLLIRIVGMKFKKLKSSSLQSLERGKPSEIDYLNGFICRQGKKHKISTPINDLIVSMIKEIETKKREISPKNFDEFEPLLKKIA